MNVKFRKRLLWSLLFLFLVLVSVSLVFQVFGSPSAQTHKLDVVGSDGCYFLLDNNCGIWFKPSASDYIYFGDSNGLWTWIGNDAIRFYNLKMDSSSVPNPFELTVTGPSNITFTKLFSSTEYFQTEFTWSGSGSSSVSFSCGDAKKPYYIKIGQEICNEGYKWSYDSATNKVTITDTLSTKNVVISWLGLPPPQAPAGSGPKPAPISEPKPPPPLYVQVLQPALAVISEYFVSGITLGFLLLAAVLSHKADESALKVLFIFFFILLSVNFFLVYIAHPLGFSLPQDLQWVQRLLWKPPSLSLQVYGLPTEQTLYMQMLVIGVCTFLFIGAFYLMTREE